MANSYFQFKQFAVHQDRCAMKVTTDACLFGAWVAEKIRIQASEVRSLLDIGTGTGLLSLMLTQKNPELKIDAIEMDEEAAQQANENILSSLWQDTVNVINADARSYSYVHKYDIVISNPPFYEKELKGDDKRKNIAHHNEGLLLHELLAVIKNNLKVNGRFFLLLPYKRNPEIKDLLRQHEFDISEMIFVRQSEKHDFFRIMLTGKLNPNENTETVFDEISIWNEKQQYTPGFVSLLKDYYLYL